MSATRLFILILLSGVTLAVFASNAEREAKQAELDAACDDARNQKLVPLREKMVDICLQDQEFETREKCENYYADYGERAGRRPAMFYDLPACVKAFEYAQSERSGG